MKYVIVTALIVLSVSACGRLSDEERKKLRDGMEQNKIVKISDDEIVATGLDEGRAIFDALQKGKFSAKTVDSLSLVKAVRIHWTKPGDAGAQAIEQQLIDAYVNSIVTGDLQDNIQKLYREKDPKNYDSLVYSKPIITVMANGVENLDGVWNIYLSKRSIVIAASKK